MHPWRFAACSVGAVFLLGACVDKTASDERGAVRATDGGAPATSTPEEPDPVIEVQVGPDATCPAPPGATEVPEGAEGAVQCAPPGAPLLLDFAAGDTFGDFAATLSGGTYVYPSSGDYALVSDFSAGDWHISGTVGDYSGFALFLQDCTRIDASAYRGIRFTISGTLEVGTQINFHVGTAADEIASAWFEEQGTPADAPNFGRCRPASTNQYDGTCGEPTVKIPITQSPQVVTVCWDNLRGGVPESGVVAAELTRIGWTLEPPAGLEEGAVEAYAIDLRVDDVSFVE